MGQDTAGSILGVGQAAVAKTEPVSAEERTFRQSVVAAARQLNESGYPGNGREVTYSIDPQSRRPVVRLIESQSREVIAQWPAEHALALAAENRKIQDSA